MGQLRVGELCWWGAAEVKQPQRPLLWSKVAQRGQRLIGWLLLLRDAVAAVAAQAGGLCSRRSASCSGLRQCVDEVAAKLCSCARSVRHTFLVFIASCQLRELNARSVLQLCTASGGLQGCIIPLHVRGCCLKLPVAAVC